MQTDNEFQKIKNMHKKESKVEYAILDNAIILPRKFEDNAHGWGLGGVCDKNNEFIEMSCYHGGWIDQGGKYEWDNEINSNDKVIYIGLFFKHWGHFLVDLSTRLWLLSYPELYDETYKVAFIGEQYLTGNYLEFFELLGITKDRMLLIDKPTRFNTVIVPDHACRPCIWYTDEYIHMYDTITKNALIKTKSVFNQTSFDKVYFTRLGLPKAQNTEVGEKEIAKLFEDDNYQIISPEKLSLSEQIFIWNNTNKIACINGSIPINIAFSMNKDLELIILNKTSILHLNLYLYTLMRNTNHTYIDAYYEPFKEYPKSLGEGPFLLWITDDLIKFFKKHEINKKQIKLTNNKNELKYYTMVLNLCGRLKTFLCRIYKRLLKVLNKNDTY